MQKALTIFLAGLILATFPLQTLAFDPNYLISDWDLTDPFALGLNQIQYYLERGYLSDYITEDYNGDMRYAADIIWRAAQNHGISAKFLLVLIQKEQSLVEDDDPTQKQLDWAAGYAVCDNCSMNDPAIQRWKGFGKQINSAAMQFTDGYLADIEAYGTTQGKYGPGVPVEIDGTTVVPGNAATAALYAYTPHLHGNENFTIIWERWFSIQYPTGSLLKSYDSPDVYLIQYGYKRPINSWSAFVSRFNADLIVEVAPETLANYPDGSPIDFPNYSLLRDDDGTIYLLVDDSLRAIDSMETFYAIGYKEDEIVDIGNADLAYFTTGAPITTETIYPQGNLLELEGSGALFYIQDGERHQIFDPAILAAKFPNQAPEPALPMVVEQYSEGTPVLFPDGYLVKGEDEPTVYIISEEKKRPIESEAVFTSYGWSWDDILVVSDQALKFHETGLPIEDSIE